MLLQIDNLGKVSITVEEDYWSINKDYDKLTIVEKEDIFGTFISRKPVPAGTEITNRKYWIPFSSLKEDIVLRFGEVINKLNNLDVSLTEKEAEIYKAMAALTAGGLVLKQTFGDSETVGISQKAITKKIDELQDKIDNLHPGTIGVTINATPNIIYDNENTNVTVVAQLVNQSIAEEIKIFIDDELISTEENVSELTITEIFNQTKVVRVQALQKGFTYENSITVIGTKPFYIGSGIAYTNIVDEEHKQSIKNSPVGTYNINVATDGHYIFFVVPETMNINNATMGGFEFPLEEPQSVTISDNNYKVYRSSNTYDTGVLNIVLS